MRIEIGKAVQAGRNSGKAKEGWIGQVSTAWKGKADLLGPGDDRRRDFVRDHSEFFWGSSDYFGKIISSCKGEF